MKYTQLLVLVLSVFFLSACSSSGSSVAGGSSADMTTAKTAAADGEEAADAKDDDGYRCEKVAVTGTRMTQKYCTTRKQREEIARSAASGMNRMTVKNTQAGGPSAN